MRGADLKLSNNALAGFLSVCLWLTVGSNGILAQSVVVTLDLQKIGPQIPADFAGLSLETSAILNNRNAHGRFNIDGEFAGFCRSLGLHSLHVGGTGGGGTPVVVPSNSDIDALFSFAHSLDLKVIYTLRMSDRAADDEARVAAYIVKKYRSNLQAFELQTALESEVASGKQFLLEWQRLAEVLHKQAGDVPICGPGISHHDEWFEDFVRQAQSEQLVELTQAYYPGGGSDQAMAGEIGRELLLSPVMMDHYVRFFTTFAGPAFAAHLPLRLDVCNSFRGEGLTGTSDTMAQTLWGLDLLCFWGQWRAAGVNFHQPSTPISEKETQKISADAPAAVWRSAGPDVEASPLAYALKTFGLGNSGRIVTTGLRAGKDTSIAAVNLTAYATLADDNTLFITLINKQHAKPGQPSPLPMQVILRGERPSVPYAMAYEQTLSSPADDIAATGGYQLGGSTLKNDGTWNGVWTKLAPGPFTVTINPASAMVVKIVPGLPQAKP